MLSRQSLLLTALLLGAPAVGLAQTPGEVVRIRGTTGLADPAARLPCESGDPMPILPIAESGNMIPEVGPPAVPPIPIPNLCATSAAGERVGIRGPQIIGAVGRPLYVVNGQALPRSASEVNPLDDIPPQNIESITVLKGAAAAQQFGSLAASGVVMIQLKAPAGSITPR